MGRRVRSDTAAAVVEKRSDDPTGMAERFPRAGGFNGRASQLIRVHWCSFVVSRDHSRTSARSRMIGARIDALRDQGLASWATQVCISRPAYLFSVAQIFNLPYRRFLIGRTFLAGDRWQVKNLRYSRLQVCATGAARTLNTYKVSTLGSRDRKPLKSRRDG